MALRGVGRRAESRVHDDRHGGLFNDDADLRRASSRRGSIRSVNRAASPWRNPLPASASPGRSALIYGSTMKPSSTRISRRLQSLDRIRQQPAGVRHEPRVSPIGQTGRPREPREAHRFFRVLRAGRVREDWKRLRSMNSRRFGAGESRSTRRSATVTICVPDASIACRMISGDVNFPVPRGEEPGRELAPGDHKESLGACIAPVSTGPRRESALALSSSCRSTERGFRGTISTADPLWLLNL